MQIDRLFSVCIFTFIKADGMHSGTRICHLSKTGRNKKPFYEPALHSYFNFRIFTVDWSKPAIHFAVKSLCSFLKFQL